MEQNLFFLRRYHIESHPSGSRVTGPIRVQTKGFILHTLGAQSVEVLRQAQHHTCVVKAVFNLSIEEVVANAERKRLELDVHTLKRGWWRVEKDDIKVYDFPVPALESQFGICEQDRYGRTWYWRVDHDIDGHSHLHSAALTAPPCSERLKHYMNSLRGWPRKLTPKETHTVPDRLCWLPAVNFASASALSADFCNTARET